ncbi:uncharacterized protein LOC120249283 [Dioscorea cayenensis subsp. rotundata]|uniref:Uncharacterized protein LOC120249283 n=1 Tax=Dioscorea cayennensis subsp. rotundata TaxID=55577 RepID=A0AB40AFX4_DIOCR|nr:uncharacterized protein LOC120249283 [Dioscorea cayenensis subsp. rotundata]
MGWNSSLMDGTLVHLGEFSLTMEFVAKKGNLRWRCTTLTDVYGVGGIPWVICGDLNAIFNLEDKPSGNYNWEDISKANTFLQDLALQEPPPVGRRFTWTNNQEEPIWVKLDRFLINNEWLTHFPRVVQMSLPRLGSDHVPLRLEVGNHISRPRLFRYEWVWSTVEGFQELVQHWWSVNNFRGCGAYIISKKIAGIRAHLLQWAKFDFGSIKLKKLALMQELETLDTTKETRGLILGEIQKENDLLLQLEVIRKQEEVYWKQRSRLQWLKEGDENTKFFHAVANGRRNRNFIPGLNQGGALIVDPWEIGKMFATHFNQQFGSRRSFRLRVDFQKLFQLKNQWILLCWRIRSR